MPSQSLERRLLCAQSENTCKSLAPAASLYYSILGSYHPAVSSSSGSKWEQVTVTPFCPSRLLPPRSILSTLHTVYILSGTGGRYVKILCTPDRESRSARIYPFALLGIYLTSRVGRLRSHQLYLCRGDDSTKTKRRLTVRATIVCVLPSTVLPSNPNPGPRL